MWPFVERLKDQDAVKKYRHWLRRWLLNNDERGGKKVAPGGRWASGGFAYN
ncbi:MAG: hypothetical protein MJA84_05125 [Firmicutes bacterium]|nr:hypothetical protein [Bacillota bacterium]